MYEMLTKSGESIICKQEFRNLIQYFRDGNIEDENGRGAPPYKKPGEMWKNGNMCAKSQLGKSLIFSSYRLGHVMKFQNYCNVILGDNKTWVYEYDVIVVEAFQIAKI